jgi:Na+-transporting methylmalonyl-CoA/oxaloacetate decarboxylase gamma subunit
LRLSQEHACDDIVLNGGASAEKYAGQLVEVVRNLQGDRFISQHAMAMAQPSTLETRVRAIVDDTRDRSPCLRRGVFCGMAFVCVALVLGTAAQFCGAVERKVVPEEGDSPSIAQPDETPRLNIRDEKKASTVADKTTARVPLVFIESRFVEISEDASQPANPVPLPEGLTEAGNNTPGVVGVLTEKQFQTVFKQLTQKKGVDLMTTPSVTARSNQVATIEVVREFVYPSEFDKDKQNGDMKPKNFETKKVGVILGVTGVIQPDNTIDLNLKPQVVEFEGFNKGKNGEQQPVFSERKLNTDVAVLPGQTVVMALGSKTDTQTVEDRVWFFFKKKSTHTVNRRVLVFVTAKIIKPVIAEKSVTITSDSLEYDKATGAVTATGNVKIETPQAVITADKAGIKTNAEATAPQSDRKEK